MASAAADRVQQQIQAVQADICETKQQLGQPPEGWDIVKLQERLNILEQKELELLKQQPGVAVWHEGA